ncbi:MAG: putative dehydrogenase [Candidatus Omnitrophota bacterium]|jgi:predicted dehydrogenase
MKKRVGFIGCGQWGPNQIRTFFFHPDVEVVRICDTDQTRLDAMRSQFTHLQITTDSKDITQADDIDAVIVTTPVSTHHAIAKDALINGKDVLCEKPLTMTSAESLDLIQVAKEHNCILMVGHVFLFNAGIVKLKEMIDKSELGKNYYFHAKRTNLGPVRNDVNAVYDLASHDISIFNYFMNSTPKVVGAVGKAYLRADIEDVAFISLEYPGGVLAHIHVSWLDPKKIREITVVGDKKMATWDDLSPNGSVEIYTKHIEKDPYYKDFGEFNLLAKDGEIVIPNIKNVEPLKAQTNHFIECIRERKAPLADGQNGLDVVRTLEEIDQHLKAYVTK